MGKQEMHTEIWCGNLFECWPGIWNCSNAYWSFFFHTLYNFVPLNVHVMDAPEN